MSNAEFMNYDILSNSFFQTHTQSQNEILQPKELENLEIYEWETRCFIKGIIFSVQTRR